MTRMSPEPTISLIAERSNLGSIFYSFYGAETYTPHVIELSGWPFRAWRYPAPEDTICQRHSSSERRRKSKKVLARRKANRAAHKARVRR